MSENTFSIDRHQAVLLPPQRPLTVISGESPVWITQTGDPHDYIVKHGESIAFSGAGVLIAQALSQDVEFLVRTPNTPFS